VGLLPMHPPRAGRAGRDAGDARDAPCLLPVMEARRDARDPSLWRAALVLPLALRPG